MNENCIHLKYAAIYLYIYDLFQLVSESILSWFRLLKKKEKKKAVVGGDSSLNFKESQMKFCPTFPLGILKARRQTKAKTFLSVVYADAFKEMLIRGV